MNINEVLKKGREDLSKENIDPREARLLLVFVLGVRKEELLAIQEISEEKYREYQELLNRRITGEPFAYLVGHKEFMKLDFKVNANVLIPRDDTEILVEEVIDLVHSKKNQLKADKPYSLDSYSLELFSLAPIVKILDMCTGSGCIAISLAKLLKNIEVSAVDVSEKALEVAKENAQKNEANVNFVLSNLFAELHEKYDVIVSNPPYIQTKVVQELQKEVKREPILALDGGETGLDFYQEIIEKAPNFLQNNGILAFEIGYDQGEEVAKRMIEKGFQEVTIKKDLGNQDRVITGIWRNI